MIEKVIAEIKSFSGIKRKKEIHFILNKLKDVYNFGNTVYPIGDDAAVLKDGTEYLLLAAEEINRTLLRDDPQWAGFCSVLTNVNDIYAMGGKPMAMVNAVSFQNHQQGEEVFEGIRKACKKYRVPMVGGHFTPESESLTLTVAIIGKAKNILTSFNAQEGDDLIIALDLKGKQYKNYLNWDCITDKASEEVIDKLGVLPFIADNHLAHSAKDISNAGIIGTIGMLLETSRQGGEIFLDAIPAPGGINFIEWLKMYPSYGFILSSNEKDVKELFDILFLKGYNVSIIGKVKKEKKVILSYQKEEGILFEFDKDSILGNK